MFDLPNSLLPLFWEVLLYPAACYHTVIHRVTVDTTTFTDDPMPPSTLRLIGSGADTWPKPAQAAALSPRSSKIEPKSHLADLLNRGDLGSMGDHVFLISIGKTGFQRDKEMTKQLIHIGESWI